MDQVTQYIMLIQMASGLGHSLVDIIHAHATTNLTSTDLQRLEDNWDTLVQRTASNAGVPYLPRIKKD